MKDSAETWLFVEFWLTPFLAVKGVSCGRGSARTLLLSSPRASRRFSLQILLRVCLCAAPILTIRDPGRLPKYRAKTIACQHVTSQAPPKTEQPEQPASSELTQHHPGLKKRMPLSHKSWSATAGQDRLLTESQASCCHSY